MRPMRLVSLASLIVFALFATGGVSTIAQETAPADALFPEVPGLPELQVTATDTGYEGVPDTIEAGWYLLTLDNQSAGEVGLEFLGVPPGMTAEELIALVLSVGASPPDAAAGATPAGGSTAAEVAEGPETPDFYYQVHMPGGPYAEFPGQTVQAVVELRPGDYMVWAGLPGMPQMPRPLAVTEPATATPAPEIEADLTITEVGSAGEFYAFEYEGELAPGPQVVEIFNPSDQPHFVVFIQAPGALTQEEAVALLGTPPGATPPAGLPDSASLIDAAGSGTQSAGTRQWIVTNLEPGYYIVACFITDPASEHLPHAFQGMIDVIQVGDGGTPAS
jgi:hypothetical protein